MSDLAGFVRANHRPNPGGTCKGCAGTGSWETECCSGSGGCSCRGEMINMGRCRVCGGSGIEQYDSDPGANIASIEGFGFIGSGPRGGSLFDDLPRMGRRGGAA